MFWKRLLSLAITCLIATFAWSLAATAATHYVQNGESIGAAISIAASGDTILVGPGTYASFTVDKELSIIGEEGPDKTKIQSNTSVTFQETADGSRLSGFTITISGDDGILVAHRCHHLTIENNLLSGSTQSGIYLNVWDPDSTLNYVTIRNNTIVYNNEHGIYVNQYNGCSADITGLAVQNNIIAGNSLYGFARTNDATCNFEGNSISNNNFWENSSGAVLRVGGVIVNSTTGNKFVEPLFVDDDPADFHLDGLSPCIDAGAISSVYNDPDGTRNDMGVYGGPGAVNWWPSPAGGPVVTTLSVTPPSVAENGTLTLNATGEIR